MSAAIRQGRQIVTPSLREGSAGLDVGYSNIFFSLRGKYAPSSSHRPRETDGITSNCRPREDADRPYIHPNPISKREWNEGEGGREKEGEGKIGGREETKKKGWRKKHGTEENTVRGNGKVSKNA